MQKLLDIKATRQTNIFFYIVTMLKQEGIYEEDIC
jgi:hypothetical protein